jgi:hypothetical protein
MSVHPQWKQRQIGAAGPNRRLSSFHCSRFTQQAQGFAGIAGKKRCVFPRKPGC